MSGHLAQSFERAAESHRMAREHAGNGALDQATFHKRTVSMHELLLLHGEASASVTLLIMAAICMVPVGGAGTLLSMAMTLLAWRWARRVDSHQLPDRLGRVRLSEAWTSRLLRGFAWMYRAAELLLRPRWTALVHDRARPWWAIWITIMAALIFLPIPLGNVLPGLSLMMLSLGFMFRDGVMLLFSKLVGAAALGFAWTFSHLLWEGLEVLNAWVVSI